MGKNIELRDINVLIIGYNRPELLTKRLNEVLNSGVVNLFLSIDGGKYSHTPEMEFVKKNAINNFKDINLKLIHHQENLGLTRHLTLSINEAFSTHKYMILIEDDIKISENFFNSIISGLNFQEKMNLNGIVSGFSPFFNSKIQNKWRKTHVAYLWGWGCSSKVWNGYNWNLENIDLDFELSHSSIWKGLNKYQKRFWIRKFQLVKNDPYYSWDYQFNYHSFINEFNHLSPVFSFVNNEGFNNPLSSHTKGKPPKNIARGKINHKIPQGLTKFSKIYKCFDFDNYVTQLQKKLMSLFKKHFLSSS